MHPMFLASPIAIAAALTWACRDDPYASSSTASAVHSLALAQRDLEPPCAPWTKNTDPVWDGFFMAADPSVIRDGDIYRLYFTGYLPEPERSLIGMAVSKDGVSWEWATPTDPEHPISIALDARPGEWDAYLETNHVVRVGDEFWMFYAGYDEPSESFVSPYEIGLATSTDGLTWTRASDEPVLPLADAGPDNGAMTSPAVVEFNGTFYMVYLGWQLDENGSFVDFRINGAVSDDPAGLIWTRHPEPVLSWPIEDLPWLDAATEPTLMRASDGYFYLFITADDGESVTSPSNIAVLRSCHPFGPWEACPEAILEMTEPWEDEEIVAPHVIEDNGLLRMWYHGLTFNDPETGERFRIGYAETDFAPGEPADIDGDGFVDVHDLLLLLAAWGPCGAACPCEGDVNMDRSVNVPDLLVLLGHWGRAVRP